MITIEAVDCGYRRRPYDAVLSSSIIRSKVKDLGYGLNNVLVTRDSRSSKHRPESSLPYSKATPGWPSA